MIPINDLRIRNIVSFSSSIICGNVLNKNTELIVVDSINRIGFINEIDGQGGIDNDDLIGIPITEKILLQCGFEYGNYSKHLSFELNGIFEECDYLSTMDFINFKFGYYGFKKIEYLHQMQNFIFSLTGKELQINIEDL